ncbi:MAG: hypothetical protein JF591_03195 [Lysobacter sp.]|nr:hypothetical protein [Lysobacter sp.]
MEGGESGMTMGPWMAGQGGSGMGRAWERFHVLRSFKRVIFRIAIRLKAAAFCFGEAE